MRLIYLPFSRQNDNVYLFKHILARNRPPEDRFIHNICLKDKLLKNFHTKKNLLKISILSDFECFLYNQTYMICILADVRIRQAKVYSSQIDSWMIEGQICIIAHSTDYPKFNIFAFVQQIRILLCSCNNFKNKTGSDYYSNHLK